MEGVRTTAGAVGSLGISIRANEKSSYFSISVYVPLTGKNISKLVFYRLNSSSRINLSFHKEVYLGKDSVLVIFLPLRSIVRFIVEGSNMLIDFIRPLVYSKNIFKAKYILLGSFMSFSIAIIHD